MKKGFIALIVVGSVLVVGGVTTVLALRFINSANRKPVTHTYEIKETVNSFDFDLSTANLEFVSGGDEFKVVCNEREKEYHEVSVIEDTLSITYKNDLKWYEDWFRVSNKMSVTVYLPDGEYNSLNIESSTGDILINKDYSFTTTNITLSTGDVDMFANVKDLLMITSSTGDIRLEEVDATSVSLKATSGKVSVSKVNASEYIALKTSTGNINVEEVNAKYLTTNSSTGNLTISNTILSGELNSETSTGNVKIIDSDAKKINIKTSTGDVNATFLTSKIVFAETSTGDIKVPRSLVGDECDIKTSTGDITVTIKE